MSQIRVKMLARVVTTNADGEPVTLEAGDICMVDEELIAVLDKNTESSGFAWYEESKEAEVKTVVGDAEKQTRKQAQTAKQTAATKPAEDDSEL